MSRKKSPPVIADPAADSAADAAASRSPVPDPGEYNRARIAIALSVLKKASTEGTVTPKVIDDVIRLLEDVLHYTDGTFPDPLSAFSRTRAIEE